jgi:hypothetical protein
MMEFSILMYLVTCVFILNDFYVGSTSQSIWDAIIWPVLLFMYCLDNLITYLENKEQVK